MTEANEVHLPASLLARMEAPARQRDGVARQAEWRCEDGWTVIYTTTRVEGGPHHGKFLAQAFRPVGPGARTGKAQEWEQAYRREFSTRKAARARALALYRQHSPKWAARNAEETGGAE